MRDSPRENGRFRRQSPSPLDREARAFAKHSEAFQLVLCRCRPSAEAYRATRERRLHAHRGQNVRRRTLPDEQAEPDETAMPLRSKAIISVSALAPGNANSVVFGSAPLRAENDASGRDCAQVVFEPSRSAPCAGLRRRNSSVMPRPRPRSRRWRRHSRCRRGRCAPGRRRGSAARRNGRSRPADQRAGALRPADLVRGDRHQVGAERSMLSSIRPAPCTASTWSRPWRHERCGHLGDRLDHAGFVVGEHQRDQNALAARARRRCSRGASSTTPFGVDRQFGRLPGEAPPASTDGCRSPRRATVARPLVVRVSSAATAPAIGFGTAGGEDDVVRVGARRVQRPARAPFRSADAPRALGMHRRRIAVTIQRRTMASAPRPERRSRIPVEKHARGH